MLLAAVQGLKAARFPLGIETAVGYFESLVVLRLKAARFPLGIETVYLPLVVYLLVGAKGCSLPVGD